MNGSNRARNLLLGLLAVAILIVGSRLLRSGGGNSESGTISPLVTVRAGTVTRATLHAYVSGYGTVTPEPAGGGRAAASSVAPAVSGIVSRVAVREGARVSEGDLLIELDDRPIRAGLAAARAGVEEATQALQRAETLRGQGNLSERVYQETVRKEADARAALQGIADSIALYRVTAPVGGTVTRIFVGPGENVDPSAPVAEVMDLGRLILAARIPAEEAGDLRDGLPVEIEGPDGTPLPGRGTLIWVGPAASPDDGSVPVRIRPPAGTGLRPGVVLSFRIVSGEHADRIVVPLGSVVSDADGRTVVAVISGGIARLLDVTAGYQDSGLVEVSGDGLAVGDSVVTVGAYALPSGTRVRVLRPSDEGTGADGR